MALAHFEVLDVQVRLDVQVDLSGWWCSIGPARPNRVLRSLGQKGPFMSQQHSTASSSPSSASAPQTLMAFPPIPLASGNTLPGTDGGHYAVSSVTILLTRQGSTEPTEIVLEERFGGWWAPTLKPTATAAPRRTDRATDV